MKALILNDTLTLNDLAAPMPKADEALIRVSMAGICNTDLELIKGYMGFKGVLGHEFVGVVQACQHKAWLGKRVCGEINFGCRSCEYCRRGMSRHCPRRTVLGILNQNGAFAEMVVVPVSNLHEVPATVSDESAVFVEPLAAALEILEQCQIQPGHRVGIVGDGKLALLLCQVVKLSGAEILLIGKHANKMALAESFGVKTAPLKQIPVKQFDYVVEVSGSPTGFAAAMQALKPRGVLILKSTYNDKLQLDAAPIVIDEITIVGSRCGPFDAAIRLLQQNLVQVQPLVERIFPFHRAVEAIGYAKQNSTLKVLLRMASQ
ncbi:MAG: alcohol dehydrogenase catalytic domain-containing protein [bacterium]